MTTIECKQLIELDERYVEQAAEVFVEGFYKQLSLISKNKSKLIRALKPSIRKEHFFVALQGERIIGIAAYSTHQTYSQVVKKELMREEFGRVKGWLMMTAFSNRLVELGEDQCFIENVTTIREFRRQGVARQLVIYMMNQLDFNEYVLEVVDTNQAARNLYEGLGFTTFRTVKQRFFRRINGFTERFYLIKRMNDFY